MGSLKGNLVSCVSHSSGVWLLRYYSSLHAALTHGIMQASVPYFS